MMLEPLKQTFAELGVIKLDAMIGADTVSPARELIYAKLTRAGFCRDHTWVEPTDRVEARKRLKAALKGSAKSSVFKNLLTREEGKTTGS